MMFDRLSNLVTPLLLVQTLLVGTSVFAQEWKSGVEWPEPRVIAPGVSNSAPPSDAIVLFDGTNLSQWEGGDQWLVSDGVAIPREGGIQTKQSFGDIQLHLEWAAPSEIEGEGQGRGNSGVFLMSQYEVQILDSYHNGTYFDGQAGAIYKQTPPLVNAMRSPGQWNAYDIIFTAPRFRVNGTLREPAHVTVIHNGVLVLNHFEILGSTGFTEAPSYKPHAEKAPISLQFHNDAVQFRNVWVREIKPIVGRRVGLPYNVERPQATNKPDPPKTSQKEKASKPTS